MLSHVKFWSVRWPHSGSCLFLPNRFLSVNGVLTMQKFPFGETKEEIFKVYVNNAGIDVTNTSLGLKKSQILDKGLLTIGGKKGKRISSLHI
uniref:Uncharacterized protein n=1 Tax=Rhizophora mucronata TaxID=61149 RepID=A0A2P2L7A4_RHIMU